MKKMLRMKTRREHAQIPRSGYIQKPGVSRAAAPPQVNSPHQRTPKAFHKGRFPDEFLVVFDSVFSQKTQKFILKRLRPVMLLLILDVLLQAFHVRWAHRERTVSTLPLKCLKFRRVRLQPLRRIALEFANQVSHGDCLANLTENVHVVFDTAHNDRRRVLLSTYPGEVCVEGLPSFFVLKKRLSVVGRKHDVKMNLRERLSHGGFLLWNAFGVRRESTRYLGWRRFAADPRLMGVTASRYSHAPGIRRETKQITRRDSMKFCSRSHGV
jgi:hypothetical protein